MTTWKDPSEQSLRIASELPRWPFADADEEAAVLRVIRSDSWWRVQGSEVVAFEKEFAEATGFASALAVTNGTHALELALQVMGVGPGDEVIVPSFTFVSTGMAVERLGARMRFADVDLDDHCILPSEIERLSGPSTRVVIPVHMAGHPCDMDEIDACAARSGLSVLQDAAHAQGATYRDRPIGALGSPAIYSFQNGKLMTAGEGGAIGVPSGALRAPYLVRHNCGRDPADRVYEHDVAGSNFRMSELHGAVLRCQLRRIDDQIDRREDNVRVFTERLAERTDRIRVQARRSHATRVPHYMLMIRLVGDDARERRTHLVEQLRIHDIPIFHNYRPLYRLRGLTSGHEERDRCANSEQIWRDGCWLHHRVLLAEPTVVAELADLLVDVDEAW